MQQLRDAQTRISERNRLDSVQLLRIQNNLSELAFSMRDMVDRTEGYPMVSWRQTFDRLKADLDQAIVTEQTLAPAERPAAQQERLVSSVAAFWTSVDEAFVQAQAGHEDQTALLLRTTVEGQRQQLVTLVSQFLVLNNRVQEDAAQLNQAIYGRVVREIFILMAVLLVIVGGSGMLAIRANRRAFDQVERLSAQLRSLSWRMMRMQEDLQEAFPRAARRVRPAADGDRDAARTRQAPAAADSPLVADLEEVRGIVQQTLEKIRTESRLLHPVILDDFGLEKALEWYVEQFGRQHGIAARFLKGGPIGVVSPEADDPHLSDRAGSPHQREPSFRID